MSQELYGQISASSNLAVIQGVIQAIEYYQPGIRKSGIAHALRQVCRDTHTEEELDYYIEYFGLIESGE